MRGVSLGEILSLHELILSRTGGSAGVRDLKGLESAMAQPDATYDGTDLYPTLEEKASALCFALVSNHPFVDGNKRVGHAALELFLLRNGYEIRDAIANQEQKILDLAAGNLGRDSLLEWIRAEVAPKE